MYTGPKTIKHKKIRKGKLSRIECKSNVLCFGSWGIKAAESGSLNSNQIEAARQVLTRSLRKTVKIWIRIFPGTPVTKKSKGSRMGKGVGQIAHWHLKIGCGSVLFEICGANSKAIIKALKMCSQKLPIKTRVFK